MSSVAIQMRLGETSRKEYVSFKEALAERPGNVELLLRFRAWIRRALADSVVHPAWSVAFEGVAVQSADEELERLRTQVHETLRRDFEDAGRLLEA